MNTSIVSEPELITPPIVIDPDPPVPVFLTTVTVLSPLGGSFAAGQSITVTWDTQGPVDAHAVRLSLDAGNSFMKLTPVDLGPLARSFSFTAPQPSAVPAQCVLQVVAKRSGTVVARGNSPVFTIGAAQPTITRITPTQGSFGQAVTIEGSRFFNTRQVLFGSAPAPFTLINDTMISTTVPISRSVDQGPLTVDVSVVTDNGTAISPVPFTVLPVAAAQPVVDTFNPVSGAAGTVVTVYGRNFTGVADLSVGAQRGVFFRSATGETRAPILGSSDGTVVVQVPADAITGSLKLVAAGGTAFSAAAFVVQSLAGSVTLSASPSSVRVVSGGSVSFVINIARSNFSGPVNLSVSGLPDGAFASITPNPASGGAALVTVSTTALGTTLGRRMLTISGTATVPVTPAIVQLEVGLAPRINGFDPTVGAAGRSVNIFGFAIGAATQVRFNGTAASFFSVSDSQIIANVPAGATDGPIQVTTPFGTATSAASFDVTMVDGPVITSFAPTHGGPGTVIQIFGRNFDNFVSVDIAGAFLTNPMVNADATVITATIPDNVNTGRVLVSTASGSTLSDAIFILDPVAPPPPPPGGAPTISAVRPLRGAVGSTVTILGSNFVPGRTGVAFGAVPAVVTLVTATQINAVVPDGARSGPITVSTPSGSATSAVSFFVIASLLGRGGAEEPDGAALLQRLSSVEEAVSEMKQALARASASQLA